MTRKVVISFLIALLVSLITLSLYSLHLFDRAEYQLYDLQAKHLRADKKPDSKIKVVLVDEAALKSVANVAGRWPWPRAIWSDVLDFFSLGGARAVLFDILFLEPDRYDPANDAALVQATAAAGNVYHSMIITRERPDKGGGKNSDLNKPLPADFVARFAVKHVTGSLPPVPETENNEYTLPIPGLADASRGVDVVEFKPDSDNGYRRTQPLREYQGKYYPVMGLAPFINDTSRVTIGDHAITINDRTIPVDARGNCLINMYSPDKVESYSLSGIFASLQKIRQGDVQNLVIDPSVFKDSIVFIGASAVGTADLKAIPMAPSVPGVMLHAFLANNYLLNDFMEPPNRHLTILFLFIGAFLTAGAVMFTRRFVFRAVFPTLLLVLYVAWAITSFQDNRQVELVPFIFSTVSTGFLSFGYLTFTEAAEKRRVSTLFSQYVSKDVLNEVLHNYKEYLKSSVGQKVELTVLFSDIRSFTTMSETTPPEEIVDMLNVHFSVMAEIILRHNGTIDKYIGDAIMAFWGAPVRMADHAEQAVLAAQEMLAGLEQVNRTLRERGFAHEVRIGVGINTGPATIGNIGSEQKKNYTVVGDTVNLASRLESVTKEYHSPLVFSEYTYEKVKDKFDCKLLGNVKVKGREQPVTIYTIEA